MISSRQLAIMIALSRISVITIFLPVVTAADARQDAWIAAMFATAGGLVVSLLPVMLADRFPGKSYGEYVKIVLGRGLGGVASLLLAAFYIALVVLRSRQLAFLLIASQLEEEPGWIFAATTVLVGSYGAYLGADGLGRAAEVFLTVVAFSIVVGLLLVFISVPIDLGLLQPVLYRGWEPVLEASINPIFWFATSGAVVLVLSKYCVDHRGIVKAVLAGTAISGVTLTVMALTATVTLGPMEARAQLSPVLSLSRTVFIEGVIERLDELLMSVWIAGVAFDVAVFMLVASMLISDAHKVTARKVVLLAGSLAIFLASLRVTDVFIIRRILQPIWTGYAMVAVHGCLIGGVLLVAALRGQRGGDER